MTEPEIITRLENTIHAKNSALFADAVQMLKAMPRQSRERYVFATVLANYARSCNWQVIDGGETEALLMMFLNRKSAVKKLHNVTYT